MMADIEAEKCSC